MKLIRLVGNNANFEANFNEDIGLPKNSTICLKNLSFKRIYEILNIDEVIAFTISTVGENPISFNFDIKNYTQLDYKTFLEELARKLNQNISITNDGFFVGLQAQVGLVDNSFRMDIRKSPVYMNTDFVNTTISSNNIELNRNSAITKRDNVDTLHPEILFFDPDIQFVKGAGLFQCKIGNLIDNGVDDNVGFFMALTTEPNMSGVVKYAIQIKRPIDNFVAEANATTIAGITLKPQNFSTADHLDIKDILEIRKDGGRMIGTVRQVAGATELFNYEIPLDQQNEILYPCFGVYGGADKTEILRTRFNIDPFSGISRQLGDVSFTFSSAAIASVINSIRVPVRNTLTLTTPQKILDFLNIFATTDRDEIHWVFGNSSIPFNLDLADDNYVVEVLNLELLSYDSVRQKRMNILATIPAENTSTGILNYDVNERVCVSINNTQNLTIRNLRIRVLDKNLNPIITEGNAIMTILLE